NQPPVCGAFSWLLFGLPPEPPLWPRAAPENISQGAVHGPAPVPTACRSDPNHGGPGSRKGACCRCVAEPHRGAYNGASTSGVRALAVRVALACDLAVIRRPAGAASAGARRGAHPPGPLAFPDSARQDKDAELDSWPGVSAAKSSPGGCRAASRVGAFVAPAE